MYVYCVVACKLNFVNLVLHFKVAYKRDFISSGFKLRPNISTNNATEIKPLQLF
jgi:hypothetical protein